MIQGAIFSQDRTYRYVLWRVWDDQKPYVLFIGLNPSTADENVNDQTIRRCIDYSRRWGYGGFKIVNLFSYRATHPIEMMSAPDPIGPDTDRWIDELKREADITVICWGNEGGFKKRNQEVLDCLGRVYCLKINNSGEPAHPLRLSKELKPIPYN